MKKKDEEEPLAKLVKLTKLMKIENVKISPNGPPKGANKWRSQDPKFAPESGKTKKPAEVVEAGGMRVDPALREDYENWRKDKIAEQQERRLQSQRKWEAARKAQAALRKE